MTIRLVLLLLVAAACAPAEPGARGRARHLVLLTVDTLRADRLGCYGGEAVSPAVDALAAAGALFTRAYTPRGSTRPSMVTFFTGKYPTEHGVTHNAKMVPDGELLLAERLRAVGFATRTFTSASVLKADRSHLGQGYEEGDYEYARNEMRIATRAERYVRHQFGRDGRREFLWVHLMTPHLPYHPPGRYRGYLREDYDGPVDGRGEVFSRAFAGELELGPADHAFARELYDATVRFVDGRMGRIVEALREGGHLEDTLVVFTADHGEEMGERVGYWGHERTVFSGSTRIPMIFHQPGAVAAGRRVDGLVTSVDFLPTVLSWLDVAPGGPMPGHGHDLSRVLAGGAEPERDAVYGEAHWDEGDVAWIRTEDRLFVWNPSGTPVSTPNGPDYPYAERALYRPGEDPAETRDRLAEEEALAAELQEALAAWRAGLVRGEASTDRSEEWRRELQALGYVEHDQ